MSYHTLEQKPGSKLALEDMCNAMTVFASNGDNRETLNDTLQDICVQHGHPYSSPSSFNQMTMDSNPLNDLDLFVERLGGVGCS